MEITPPYGYTEITPLLREHRIKTVGIPEFVRNTNALPVTLGELAYACHSFPIVFAPADGGKSHMMLGVVGLADNENLLLDNNGQWLANAYAPAYVRRYPFCVTRVTGQGTEPEQRIVCVEKSALTEGGQPLFDEHGTETQAWQGTREFLFQFEADIQATQEVCQVLTDFKLLEPFTAQAKVGDHTFEFGGMARVDEKRLEFLGANELKTLIKKGAMRAIYQHLASLTQFSNLTNLKYVKTFGRLPDHLAPAASGGQAAA